MAARKRDYKAEYQRRKARAQQRYGVSYSEYRRLQQKAKAQGITSGEFRKRAFILGTNYGNLDVMKTVVAENERAHKEWIEGGRKPGVANTDYYHTWQSYFDDDDRWFFYH